MCSSDLLGAMDDQIAELRRVLEVQSDFHAARYDLACALLDEGRYDEARGEFDTLLIQVPDAPLAEMGIGLVEVERGEVLKGIPHLIKAFEVYPREGFIRFRLGQAYREIGQDRKADQLMEGLDGASGRPAISSAGTRRAKSFEVGGNARLSKANAHLNAGEAARAVVILEPLVAASPEDFSAGMSLVAGYIELKRTEEAMTLIERMASLRPENHLPMVQRATGLLQRADACREAGRWQSYDIRFQAPVFDDAAQKTANARMSVWHNGILIHDDVEVDGTTAAAMASDERSKGPLMLQDHGHGVRYRNVWFLPGDV